MGKRRLFRWAKRYRSSGAARCGVHLHRILDHVMGEVETALSTEQPTLEQITQAVLGQRQALTQAMAQELIVSHYAGSPQAQQVVGCSQCGRTLRAHGTPAWTVSTLVGELRLERP